jgi:hypothetical protein
VPAVTNPANKQESDIRVGVLLYWWMQQHGYNRVHGAHQPHFGCLTAVTDPTGTQQRDGQQRYGGMILAAAAACLAFLQLPRAVKKRAT